MSNAKYGSAQDWSEIIKGATQGVQDVLRSNDEYKNSKRESKEKKRRTLADLLNQARKRKLAMLKMQQEYEGELTGEKNEALQHAARGFAEALRR